MPNEYGTIQYWNERYRTNKNAFDWYLSYPSVRDHIVYGLRENSLILNVGCGNSRLSNQMYDDGYKHITNIDVSDVVVETMKEENVLKSEMSFVCMDVRMLDFASETFDLVVDKGCVDSIMCGENSFQDAALMMKEISRVLKPGGRFVCISYGAPDMRIEHLESKELKWTVEVKKSEKIQLDGQDRNATAEYYVYVCTKYNDNKLSTATGGAGDDEDDDDNHHNRGSGGGSNGNYGGGDDDRQSTYYDSISRKN